MNKIIDLFGVQYPIIQGGMIWCSGWELATAVSNAGGLGLIGSGSMHPETLQEHITKAKAHTDKPFGVNVPLIYPEIDKIIKIILDEQIPIVFTSAGSPKKYTALLKSHGVKVAHVVSSTYLAMKCEAAGVDAVVAEGFEAGGHNGREETTTMALIPNVSKRLSVPVIAAGGIASGRAMLAAMMLGAEAVQIGSRFAASEESSGHPNFKQAIMNANEGHTMLMLKKVIPVRLINNDFSEAVKKAESEGYTKEELEELLGHGRAKQGMFEGDVSEGELEIGQVSAQIREILPVADIMKNILNEYKREKQLIDLADKYNFL